LQQFNKDHRTIEGLGRVASGVKHAASLTVVEAEELAPGWSAKHAKLFS